MGFTDTLQDRSDEALARLLTRRPDLALPPPSTFGSLAARATSRVSLERAVATLDAFQLQTLEAVVALHPLRRPLRVDDITAAVGAPADPAVRELLDLALVWDDGSLQPAPGLAEVLGPHPAGLGPPLRDTLGSAGAAAVLALLAGDQLDLAPADQGDATAPDGTGTESSAAVRANVASAISRLADPATVHRLLDAAPPGAAQVVQALAWQPVGLLGSGSTGRSGAARSGTAPVDRPRAAVHWLLRHGLLATADPAHVVLPREIGLAIRGGRTHAEPHDDPPAPSGTAHDEATVVAESALAAQEVTRLVGELLRHWAADPPRALRSGGLGARELRRTAALLETEETLAGLLVEIAAAADLLGADDAEQPAFGPTPAAVEWLAAELPERWAVLAAAWWATDRTPWLVGTRDHRGALRSALHPELRRAWAPRLRRTVLSVLAAATEWTALSADDVLAVLRWRTPRAVPPEQAVRAVLEEAERLGVLGAGALSPAGRALLDGDTATLSAALATQLPDPVDEILLQGDLTGVVPGRPSAALADLVERAARVESRGGAMTVRFTAESVRAALDQGQSAEDLLAELAEHSRTPVPQALEYLVRDVARRHGALRVGAAASYLRAEDPTLVTAVVEDPRLAGLGLLRLAPTVAVAQADPSTLLHTLQDLGLAPVAEGADGQVVTVRTSPLHVVGRRAERRRADHRRTQPVTDAEARVAEQARAALARLRAGTHDGQDADPTRSARATDATYAGTPDPVEALTVLREAAAERRHVWLEMVGANGLTVRRRVRPVRVDGGRARVIDVDREAEITVAVHRISSATPVAGPADTRADDDTPADDIERTTTPDEESTPA